MVCLRYTQLYLACGIDNQRTAFSFQNCGTRPDQKFGMILVTKGFLKLKLPKKKTILTKKMLLNSYQGPQKLPKTGVLMWRANAVRRHLLFRQNMGGAIAPLPPLYCLYFTENRNGKIQMIFS